MSWELRHGDCVEQMRELDDASIGAVVTDPPYGLGFMGAAWDTLDGRETGTQRRDTSVAFDHVGGNHNPVDAADSARTRRVENQRMQDWHEAWVREALRVLKPGGHLLAFGGTRTYHRLACAIEDAGFEIRDTICWLYGSGFPKSLDVAKSIDKAARGVPQGTADPTSANHGRYRTQTTEGGRGEGDRGQGYGAGPGQFMAEPGERADRELADEAQVWQGFGTALKRSERNAGLEGFEEKVDSSGPMAARGQTGLKCRVCERWKASGNPCDCAEPDFEQVPFERPATANRHPTVKPIALMRWLVRLVTPPGGLVLDPFAGSGTTGCAAVLEGFDFLGSEREGEYAEIARARIGYWADPKAHDARVAEAERMEAIAEAQEEGRPWQPGLFDELTEEPAA